MQLQKLREEVVATCVDLYQNGLVRSNGAGGNVSARDTESGIIAVTPSHIRYDTMQADDIMLIDLDGNVIEGKPDRKPTSESPMHRLILKEYPHANAVVHTHSPYANALAMVYDEVPAVVNETPYFCGKSIPVAGFVTPGTDQMAIDVVEKLRDVPAMIIRNHGPVVMADSLALALQRAFVVEDSSKIYCIAKTIGKPILICTEECDKLAALSNI